MNTPTNDSTITRTCLVILTAAWLILSLYNLGTPSFFWEELLVSLTSRYPIPYIYTWSSTVETHPPFYYLIIKFFLFFGKDEFTLRLPSVIFGTGCIFAAYSLIRRLSSSNIAIMATSLLIINPVFIEWSRKERPYVLFLFIFILSVNFLLNYIRSFNVKSMLALLLCNLLLVWTHYIAYTIFLSQSLVIATCLLNNMSRDRLKSVLWLTAGMALVVLSNFNMLYATVLKHDYFETGKLSAYDTFIRQANAVLELLTYFDIHMAVTAGAALLGFVVLALRHRSAFWIAMAFLVVPIGAMSFLRANWFGANYLIFMLPLFTMAIAAAFSTLLRKGYWPGLVSVLFVSASALAIFSWHHARYYESNSYNFAINKQRDYATAINALPAGTQLVFCSESLRNAVGWYLDLMSNDAISSPVLTAGKSPANIALVVNEASCASYAANHAELTSRMGSSTKDIDAGDIKIYQWTLNRAPAIRIEATPATVDLPPAPEKFFQNVHELNKVDLNMDWGGRIIPTDNSVDTFFSYEFENSSGLARQISLGMNFHNHGKQNILKLSYKFDDEPYQNAFVLIGPSDSTHRQVVIDRTLPFDTFTVKITMNCAKETPEYPGNNLASIGVSAVQARFEAAVQNGAPVRFSLIEPGRLPGDFRMSGFGDIGLAAGRYYRWSFGPESNLTFSLPRDSSVLASMEYINFIPGQVIKILANDTPVDALDLQEYDSFEATPKQYSFVFAGKKGVNTIALRYKFWNLNSLLGKPARYLEGVDAPVALHITGMNINVGKFDKPSSPQ